MVFEDTERRWQVEEMSESDVLNKWLPNAITMRRMRKKRTGTRLKVTGWSLVDLFPLQ